MSDLDDDLFDDDLAAALRARAGGASLAVGDAHDAVLHRASTIRRRRAAVGGAGVAVLAVAGLAVLAQGTDEVGTAGTVATVVDPVTPTSTESGRVVTVPITDPDDDPPGTTIELIVPDPSGDASTAVAPDTSTPGAPGRAVSTTTAAQGGSTTTQAPPTTPVTIATTSTTATTTTTEPDTTTSTAVGLAPFTRTYTALGGSITVTWNGTALSLDAVTPADGYSAEVEDQRADRIRVRFEGDDDSRIEIRVEDGEVREQIG